MNKRIKVVVLMGGKSSEHEVSILSGTNVVSSLNSKKYEVLPVVISKKGNMWKLTTKESLLGLKNILSFRGTSKDMVLSRKMELQGINSVSQKGADVFFIAMHGPYGEDGTIQGMLELTGIPYTGSGVLASAIGMDKVAFRKIMTAEKISIPKYMVLKKGDSLKKVYKILGKLPYFVKPSKQGSSVGASIVKNKKELPKAVKLALRFDNEVLIDEYLKGLEVTCAVIGNEKPVALPVIEIKPLKGEFFDYVSKYTESGSEEIVPARISKALTKKIQLLAIQVYKAIGARDFARVDFILENNKKPVVLEINTIPGLTPMSLLPKAAKAAGMSYPELIDRIIKYARQKN